MPSGKYSKGSHDIGKNVKVVISDAGIATITIDLNQEFGPSSSGKTIIIASSEGNATLAGGGGAILGLNCYRRP